MKMTKASRRRPPLQDIPQITGLNVVWNKSKLCPDVKIDPNAIDTLVESQEIDVLVHQLKTVFHHSCTLHTKCSSETKSNNSYRQRKISEATLWGIKYILSTLNRRDDVADDCYQKESFFMTDFRRKLSTRDVLELLLEMIAIDASTGETMSPYCFAIELLYELANNEKHNGCYSLWKVEMADGSRFAAKSISIFGKVLHDYAIGAKSSKEKDCCNRCLRLSWDIFSMALTMTKEHKSKTLERIAEFDWQLILNINLDETLSFSPTTKKRNLDESLFFRLYALVVRPLLEEDPANVQAKAFIQGLGFCHDLFRRVLRRVVQTSNYRHADVIELASTLGVRGSFFFSFLNCLTRPPCDEETDLLVRHAYAILKVQIFKILSHDKKHDDPNPSASDKSDDGGWIHAVQSTSQNWISLLEPDQWKRLKSESDQERWERFNCRQPECLWENKGNGYAEARKVSRNIAKKVVKVVTKVKEDSRSFCSNCLCSGGDKQLMQCAGCNRAMYCSTACQSSHWKIHKTECRKISQRDRSALPSSKALFCE